MGYWGGDSSEGGRALGSDDILVVRDAGRASSIGVDNDDESNEDWLLFMPYLLYGGNGGSGGLIGP